MIDSNQVKKDATEASKNLKTTLVIYDYIRSLSKNIDDFSTFKIFLSKEISGKTPQEVFVYYKRKTYTNTSSNKNNNKTKVFIDLIENILLHDYISKVSEVQLLLAYYLVIIFHKQTSREDMEQNQGLLNTCLISAIDEYSCYYEILKMIDVLKEENDSDAQFFNKCKIIQNLNPFELNASLSSFLVQKDKIPNYKIEFPTLNWDDDEKKRNNKIKDIYFLLDVIKASLKMNIDNIRFELFNKFINQKDKLVAVNKVLTSLNKKNLYSLNGDDLLMKIELYKENCSFLQTENNKSNQIIDDLLKEINNYQIEVNSLNGRIQETSRKLSNEKMKSNNLQLQLSSQTKQFEKLYEESQNIKYRDICSYIIDYYICLLDEEHYNAALDSDYNTAISYIINEININFEKYKNLLLKDEIILDDLLNILLKHKNEYNSITHDSEKKEEEFIRLITNFENEEIGKKFKLLFNKTPLLKKFCFTKNNEITRDKIKNAILKV